MQQPISINTNIYVTDFYVQIVEMEGPKAPIPKPLENGFLPNKPYKVYGAYSPSETSEAYFILCNERNEFWFISTRHTRLANFNEVNHAANT